MPVLLKDWWPYIQQPYDEKWGYIWGASGILWTEARQKDIEAKYASDPEKYKDYKLAAQKGRKWIGKYVIDCSGMPYRAFNKLGVKIAHGSNSIYNSYLSKKGKLTSEMKQSGNLPKGAAILTGTEGSHGHIGTYDGAGYVIEAQGTINGVVKTKLTESKWTYWGLYKDLQYDDVPVQSGTDQKEEEPVANTSYATLRQGSKGDLVKKMQELLNKCGSSLVTDGIFGNGTKSAVMAFQKSNGLTVDGICGPKTWAKLEEASSGSTPVQTEPANSEKPVEENLTYEQKVDILWAAYKAQK